MATISETSYGSSVKYYVLHTCGEDVTIIKFHKNEYWTSVTKNDKASDEVIALVQDNILLFDSISDMTGLWADIHMLDFLSKTLPD